MPIEDRRLVAGLGPESTGWLGRMGGAGRFKHIVAANPSALGRHLDEVPLRGPVGRCIGPATRYLDAAMKLDGVGLSTASRLLASKRPDSFLAVNNANRARAGRLFEALGGFPKTPDDYLKVHAALWDLPLYRERQPSSGPRRIAWGMRIAVLDRLLYEVTADELELTP